MASRNHRRNSERERRISERFDRIDAALRFQKPERVAQLIEDLKMPKTKKKTPTPETFTDAIRREVKVTFRTYYEIHRDVGLTLPTARRVWVGGTLKSDTIDRIAAYLGLRVVRA